MCILMVHITTRERSWSSQSSMTKRSGVVVICSDGQHLGGGEHLDLPIGSTRRCECIALGGERGRTEQGSHLLTELSLSTRLRYTSGRLHNQTATA